MSEPARRHGRHLPPALMRQGMRQIGRLVLDPALPWQTQRRRLGWATRVIPVPRDTATARSVMNGIETEVVTAGGARPERTVVHFHGGGYCLGSPRVARAWAAHLSAQAACRVVLPEYRLAPDHRYPAALDDARDVMTALLSDVAPASVVVSGDSAGAGLALSAVLALRDAGRPLPAGCVLLSPWLDLGADRWAVPGLVRRDVVLSPRWLQACALAYTGRPDWADPSVSPLRAAHASLPPLLIQASSDDLLAPDAGLLAASASAAGVKVTYSKWPRTWHDFALQPGLSAAADSALSQAAWFVRTVTAA
jgi:epsilon-lactone hydrolase